MDQHLGNNQKLSSFTIVLSLINGMVGAFALFLPVFALETGYAATTIVIIVTGIFSYYASHLCLLHMANQPDIDTVILKHFNKSANMKIFYDLCVFVQLILIDFSYFELITIQCIGIFPPHQLTIENIIANAFFMLVITFLMKYFQFGVNLMAFGIMGLLSYLSFLFWVVASQQSNENPVQFKAFGSGAIQLSALMGLGFTVQSFFIPILNKSQNKKQNKKSVLITFIVGAIIFIYISIMGSYGILNRNYFGSNENQRTIQGYFDVGTWEVKLIEVIYLIHFYTVFPQFLLISKQRLFGVLKFENSRKNSINKEQIIFICISVGLSALFAFLQINIRDLIDFNGAVIGGILYYFIPTALHIKCLYFSRQKIPVRNKHEQLIWQDNKCIQEQNSKDIHGDKVYQTIAKDIKQQRPISGNKDEEHELDVGFECDCHLKDYTSTEIILDSLMIVIMIDFGIFVMVNGVITIFRNHNLI